MSAVPPRVFGAPSAGSVPGAAHRLGYVLSDPCERNVLQCSAKPSSRCKLQSGSVFLNDFEMQAANPFQPCGIFQERHGLAAPTASAVLLTQIELVDEGIAPQALKAVAEAEYDEPDRGAPVKNEPGGPGWDRAEEP